MQPSDTQPSKQKIQHWIRLKIAEENSDDIIIPGNPQPSFWGVITNILGVQNLHFSWFWGPRDGGLVQIIFLSSHGWFVGSMLIFQGVPNLEYLYFYLRSVYVTQIQSRGSYQPSWKWTKIGVATKLCTCSAQVICSGQIIATENTTDLPPNGGLVEKSPYFRET